MSSRDYQYKMLYHVCGMQPTSRMSGFGFCIKLFPAMRDVVAETGLQQCHIDRWLEHRRKPLLEVHGYDPELFRLDLRVCWGPWGVEHITVPGNACGLDIDEHGFSSPRGGAMLAPHNVDCVRQSHLLLCAFTNMMELLVNHQEMEAHGMKPTKYAEVSTAPA